MAIDKGQPVNLFPSATVAAAGTGTGAWINFIPNQGGTSFLRITNGGTGPDQRPIVTIETAEDAGGTRNREIFRSSTPLTNALVTDLIHHHALSDRYVRVIFDNPGNQDITVQAHHFPVVNLG